MNKKYNVIIVGGAIVGLTIAYELSAHGHKNICVIEKNDSITGRNQSTRNGGVIHSGLYYPSDVEPLKAKLCVEGNTLLYEFCKKYNLPHKKTGKLVIANNTDEEEFLEFFYQIGIENGIEIEKINGQEAKSFEPNIGDISMALHVPSTGSAALVPLLKKLQELLQEQGVTIMLGADVVAIDADNETVSVAVQTDHGKEIFTSEVLINAAGLYADKIAKLINSKAKYEIVPTRGELSRYRLNMRENIGLKQMHLYPAPFFYYNDTKEIAKLPIHKLKQLLKAGKVTKTLGVHVSPSFEKVDDKFVLGNIATVGPIKSLHAGIEDYTSDLKQPEDYIQKVHEFFPNLEASDLEPHYTGIMAVLKGFTDFVIMRDETQLNCINLVGMDSPAWTASFAIAKYVREKFF